MRLRKIPLLFLLYYAGELLDWETQTGGYRLTTCLVTDR
ncbi:MAG: NAD(P)/FAD-dependent oxidoreductase [Nitrospira sp.]|nr:NAD(P)/FAD-dependent oxidoreductase [Nitrospira sp.]MCP9464661.1 NAD(P)/FAD-dependent oxidoreductase [Nitrospira sp.]MCP9469672.1 NAD(P)/FAD-dependent oxidoreductase [Nitrospira sp.]